MTEGKISATNLVQALVFSCLVTLGSLGPNCHKNQSAVENTQHQQVVSVWKSLPIFKKLRHPSILWRVDKVTPIMWFSEIVRWQFLPFFHCIVQS